MLDGARKRPYDAGHMGRLLLFLELAVAACIVALSLWGTVPASIAVAPLVIVLLLPVVACVGVWPARVLFRALLDGWGSDPLRKPSPESTSVWRFLEGMAPLSGVVGAGVFAVLALSGISAPEPGARDAAREAASLMGLCGAEAAGAFLLFRSVRQTVDLLQRRESAAERPGLSDAALTRYSISQREAEVAVLLLSGLRYHEIADRLFISMKTVKTHAHRLYRKTGTRNRMELAICLRE